MSILDNESLGQLIKLSSQFRFNVDGEGGEYETIVVSGPHFEGSIHIDGQVKWYGRRGELIIDSVNLSLDG